MGHIRLSISDIEFVQDEIVLDDADLILLEEHVPRGAGARGYQRARIHTGRPFDDAVTRVWSRASLRAFR